MATIHNKEKIIYLRSLLKEYAPILYKKYAAKKINEAKKLQVDPSKK